MSFNLLSFSLLGLSLIALAGCGAGGTGANEPLPGATANLSSTLATPRVIDEPRPNIPRPETTQRPTFRQESTTTTARPFTSYVVVAGDSISRIATRYPGVSVADILRINPELNSGNSIFPGQEILIPRTP